LNGITNGLEDLLNSNNMSAGTPTNEMAAGGITGEVGSYAGKGSAFSPGPGPDLNAITGYAPGQ